MAAFISMCGTTPSAKGTNHQSRVENLCNLSTSRRDFNTKVGQALLSGLLFPFIRPGVDAANAQEKGQLPDGARQFSQVISAQKQWDTIKDSFKDGHEPDDGEWKNLRTYLRMVYAVSGDMDFLTKKWEKTRRQSGQEAISAFRKAVRAMDKPAADQDVAGFLEGHEQVASLFVQFLDVLKQDTIGDMPEDL